MNLRQEILKEHSRKQADKIANWVCEDQARLNCLFELLHDEEMVVVQRAAYPIGIVGEQFPNWFLFFISEIIELLRMPKHPSVARNLYRILGDVEIPEEYQTEILDIALADLTNPQKPIAIHVFAMSVAAKIATPFPEIRKEVRLAIEAGLPNGSAGYRSRATSIFKNWQKIQSKN